MCLLLLYMELHNALQQHSTILDSALLTASLTHSLLHSRTVAALALLLSWLLLLRRDVVIHAIQ